MPTFTVTTAAQRVTLDPSGTGQAQFTVTNTTQSRVQARVLARPQPPADLTWFTIEGQAVRMFEPNATEQVLVKIEPPAGTAKGDYAFRLDAVAELNPDEDFTEGPSVSFAHDPGAPDPDPPPDPKFPWWIIVVALIVAIGIGVALWLILRDPGNDVRLTVGEIQGPTETATDGEALYTIDVTAPPAEEVEYGWVATASNGSGLISSPKAPTALLKFGGAEDVQLRVTVTAGDATLSRQLDITVSDPPPSDADSDGWGSEVDCRDDDPDIHPGAHDEPGDGIDQDCVGGDELPIDADNDGFAQNGDPADCHDDNASLNPEAEDIPADGIDQNCDGVDAVSVEDLDADGDGFERLPDGVGLGPDVDCDDNNPDINPEALDLSPDGVDQDCNGADGFVLDDRFGRFREIDPFP